MSECPVGHAPMPDLPCQSQLVADLTGHLPDLPVWAVCWSPCGNHLASASGDRTVRIWSRSASTSMPSLWPSEQKHSLGNTHQPGGNGGDQPSSASGWSCAAVLEDAHSRTVRSCAWSPGGKHLATGSFDATTAVWELGIGGNWEQVGGTRLLKMISA